MNIIRHTLTKLERESCLNIVHRAHELRSDAPMEPAPGVSTIYRSGIRPNSEIAHWLKLEDCPADLRSIKKLRNILARLFIENERKTVVIIENLPVEYNAPALLLLAGSIVGEIREYPGHGAPVVEISDKMRMAGLRPSSDNNLEFKLHTDMSFYHSPPSFVCFLMVNPGSAGGESIFCDPRPIIEQLPTETVSVLRHPFRFLAPPHLPESEPQLFPILRPVDAGIFDVRFRRDGLEPLSLLQERALREWASEVDAEAVEVPLVSGEMAIYSNTRVLHGRRAFRNQFDGNMVRRALRAYVELP